MIYQQNKLFPSPVVEKPEAKKYKSFEGEWIGIYEADCRLYESWLSSGIEVIGEHDWANGQEVVEWKDYRLKCQNLHFGRCYGMLCTCKGPYFAIPIKQIN